MKNNIQNLEKLYFKPETTRFQRENRDKNGPLVAAAKTEHYMLVIYSKVFVI